MKPKRLKTLLIAAVVLLLLAVAFVSASAEDETNGAADFDPGIQVCLFDASDAYTRIQTLPGEGDVRYALFLPAGCDRKNLRVTFDCSYCTVDSEPLVSGETTAAFAKDKTAVIETDNGTFKVKVCSSENLPALFISTESGSLDAIHADKSYKETASLTLVDGGKAVMENRSLAHIKGRGSLSWELNEKRSYNIKFTEKTGILGMAAAKKWALISNNRDCTLMRNAIVYTAAEMTRLPYTVDFRFVDLYINGSYRGNYLLCEKIEVGKNRIDINDLEEANEAANPDMDLDDAEYVIEDVDGMRLKWWKLPNEPADVSGGYLLECDRIEVFQTEASAFMSRNGACMHIRSPEHITKKEISYFSSLYDDFEQALLSPDGTNAKGKSYMDYIDVDSFVDAAVLNEFTLERDGGAASWYFYLPEGSKKFYAGPAWDFDVCMESVSAVPDSIYIAAEKLVKSSDEYEEMIQEWRGNVLLHLLSKREFVDLVAKRSTELCGVFKSQLNARTEKMFDEIASSAACDRLCWGYEITNEYDIRLRGFIPKRAKALKAYFSDFDKAVEAEVQRMRTGETSVPADEQQAGIPVIILTAALIGTAAATAGIFTARKKKRNKKYTPLKKR